MRTSLRKSIFESLDKHCIFSIGHPDHYIEVTEWSNGEGYDVVIDDGQINKLELTSGQWELISILIKELENG